MKFLTLKEAKREIARLQRALHDIATDDTAADMETLQHYAKEALDGSSYGWEAEELRSGIEKLIEGSDLIRNMVAADADEQAVLVFELQELLYRVDANDSVAFLERRSEADADACPCCGWKVESLLAHLEMNHPGAAETDKRVEKLLCTLRGER